MAGGHIPAIPGANLKVVALRSVEELDRWVSDNGWEGFDPYDIKGTPFFLRLLSPTRNVGLRALRMAALKLELYFPELLRKLFSVKPTINPKGMALFARAYLQLYRGTGREAYRSKAVECLEWLSRNVAAGYDEPCWGYPFHWQSFVFIPSGTPSSVVGSAVGDAFWTAWKILGDSQYLETCQGICRFFLKYLKRDEMADGTICFSYTPIDDFHVHNANLLVAEFLVRTAKATGRHDWEEIGIRAARYALKEQNEDGSVFYWGRVQNHYNPNRVDHYHSGFEIRCLHSIWKLTGFGDFRTATERYYAFYLRNLVVDRGDVAAPKMYPRSFYPVNIHSCAEALLLNATLAGDYPEAKRLVGPLLQWVTANMQNEDGSFTYMINRLFRVQIESRVPYMRWGQAWMMLALSQCLLMDDDSTEARG